MTDGAQKLEQDVATLAAMAAQMDDYLKSDVLFWKMGHSGMPMLTLGGYLMRQHRLLLLSNLLSEREQGELQTAVLQFNTVVAEKVVRFETKANSEIEARMRQFAAFLRDFQNKRAPEMNYETAVEPRAMIAALMDKLRTAPFQLNRQIPDRVETLDMGLRQRWAPDSFIWPASWQSAYPQDEFWWLYGRPT